MNKKYLIKVMIIKIKHTFFILNKIDFDLFFFPTVFVFQVKNQTNQTASDVLAYKIQILVEQKKPKMVQS